MQALQSPQRWGVPAYVLSIHTEVGKGVSVEGIDEINGFSPKHW